MRDVKKELSSVISFNQLFPASFTPASSLHTQNFHLLKLLGQKYGHCNSVQNIIFNVGHVYLLYKYYALLWYCDNAKVNF